MKAKNVLIFGCSGQIGRSIVRKLTKDNYSVTAVTRNIHQKGIVLKTLGNAGFINIVEANIFDEKKIRDLFKKADICINLVGIKEEIHLKIYILFSLLFWLNFPKNII